MLRLQLVAVDILTGLENGVAGVKVELQLAGAEGYDLVDISHKLLGRSRLAGIVAGRLDAAGKRTVVVEADDVVALPAVQGYRDLLQLCDCGVGVYTELCVNFFCGFVSCAHRKLLCIIFFFNSNI